MALKGSVFVKRFPLYLLAVWVMFGNHQVVKYPQACTWSASRFEHADCYDLTNCMTGDQIVSLNARHIYGIYFKKPEEAKLYGYTVYMNPKVVHWDTMDYEVVGNRSYYIDPRIKHLPGEP
jgi:hypothetical protein